MEKKNVCIIGGGGAAGLCAARKLLAVNKAGWANINITIFEKSDSIGGTWIYLEPPTNGKSDQETVNREWNVHSSMYDVLLTNLPKEVMSFEELSYDDIVNKDGDSFISREHVLTYLQEYAKPVRHLIQFNSVVLNVERVNQPKSENTTQWKVTVSQKMEAAAKSRTFTEVFDAVFVCNGHFSCPRILPFLCKYKLPSIHSHYYRKADIYSGQTVCIIGAGFSGMDICLQVAEFAKKVYLSHKKPSVDNTSFGVLPDNCIEIGAVSDASANSIILANGEELNDIDAVISCTGYKYSYPFFKDSGVIETPADGSYVSPLFAHCAHRDHLDSLFFIGLTFGLVSMAMQLQVSLATALMLHLVPQEMIDTKTINGNEAKRIKQVEASGRHLKYYHQLGADQWSYYDYIYKLSTANNILPKFKKLPPVKQKICQHVDNQRKINVQNYKQIRYRIVDDENFKAF